MPEPGERTYWCLLHGFFTASPDLDRDPDAIWAQRCPVCGRVSDLTQLRTTGIVPGSAPRVQCDRVTKPYWSQHVGRMIASKADLKRAHAELGVHPLNDADLKSMAERADSEKRESDRETAWLDRELAAGSMGMSIDKTDGDTPQDTAETMVIDGGAGIASGGKRRTRRTKN